MPVALGPVVENVLSCIRYREGLLGMKTDDIHGITHMLKPVPEDELCETSKFEFSADSKSIPTKRFSKLLPVDGEPPIVTWVDRTHPSWETPSTIDLKELLRTVYEPLRK